MIYPVYISSTKRVSEGRKVALAHACLNPSAIEIALICEAYKLRFEVDRDKVGRVASASALCAADSDSVCLRSRTLATRASRVACASFSKGPTASPFTRTSPARW